MLHFVITSLQTGFLHFRPSLSDPLRPGVRLVSSGDLTAQSDKFSSPLEFTPITSAVIGQQQEYSAPIGQYWSRDLNTSFYLINTRHVTWIPGLLLVSVGHVTWILAIYLSIFLRREKQSESILCSKLTTTTFGKIKGKYGYLSHDLNTGPWLVTLLVTWLDLNTDLWLVNTDHMTWILASDWSHWLPYKGSEGDDTDWCRSVPNAKRI